MQDNKVNIIPKPVNLIYRERNFILSILISPKNISDFSISDYF